MRNPAVVACSRELRLLSARAAAFTRAHELLGRMKDRIAKPGCKWQQDVDTRYYYLVSAQHCTWFAALDVTADAAVLVRFPGGTRLVTTDADTPAIAEAVRTAETGHKW
jgi:hypothetical protein